MYTILELLILNTLEIPIWNIKFTLLSIYLELFLLKKEIKYLIIIIIKKNMLYFQY